MNTKEELAARNKRVALLSAKAPKSAEDAAIQELTDKRATFMAPELGMQYNQTILDEAKAAVYGDRQADYGGVRENFSNIARLWSVIAKTDITPEQVGLMLVALKIARQMFRPKRDNLVDGAGYFAALEKMEKEYVR